jgi:hypothetical protein
MAEYTGQNLVVSFIHPSGTLTLNTDYRSLATNPSIGMVQATAGSDANHTYLTTVKDGNYAYRGVAQTAGTVLKAALLPGVVGTLIIGAEGTAAGAQKETCPVISMGAKYNYPYDNIVEINCDFQANGAVTLGVYP